MNERILVVDDERPICKLLDTLLTNAGYAVVTAASFSDAVSAIGETDFDLIIADIMLGAQDGIDLLRIIHDHRPRTPVVMLTGRPTIENAARSVRYGAFDYLVKPVEKENLLRSVAVGLRHRAALDREAELERELFRQKQLYQSIVEDQTEMICRSGPDGTLTFVNDAYAAYFDKKKRELIGLDFISLTPEADKAAIRAHLTAFTPARPVSGMEHRVVMADGEMRWHSWINRAFFDDAERLLEIQSVGRDITDRKRAEDALSKSRMELETAFQSIPEGILTVDASLTVIRKNRALDAICPLSDRMTPGTRLTRKALRDGGCTGACVNTLERTVRTRKAVREYHLDCEASSPSRRLVLTCAPMGGDDRGGDALLVVRDITRIRDLEARLRDRTHRGRIIGESETMHRVHALIDQLADLDNTVLITGESGTGKELVMEALHVGGARGGGPLIRVNCSALPEHLLQSELFGHVRGAFTGAVKDRAGRFQAAEGGTLFLDEIGDLPLHIQLKLLRVLERKEFERVGDDRTLTADVRIIAATHLDLARRVREGAFREDFYYRLNVMTIHLPPLRDRIEDIPDLADHFRRQFGRAFKKEFNGLADEVLHLFSRYAWPGNVRELKHVVEHACILCPGGEIGEAFLPPDFLQAGARSAPPADGATSGAPATPETIRRLLSRTDGNKAKTARLMGISRSTLYRWMREYGLV